jgi:hypothetical protein
LQRNARRIGVHFVACGAIDPRGQADEEAERECRHGDGSEPKGRVRI